METTARIGIIYRCCLLDGQVAMYMDSSAGVLVLSIVYSLYFLLGLS